MFFSEKFQISSELIKEYGAVDVSLVCDIPLFVDPMLIFNSDKDEYKKLHEVIVKYFHFLYIKSAQGLSKKEINAWFNFSEIPNNWFGYVLDGNKGLALGSKFANFLYDNISFTLTTHGISQSQHIEKTMLLYDGSGKDKISDLTVNLIKGFFCEYTERFAKEYINAELLKMFPVEKAYFNYETESFVSKDFLLPFIINEKGIPEYVLLTPIDILREDEPSINKADFYKNYDRVRSSIDNPTLRTYVNNYLGIAIKKYEQTQIKHKKPIKENSIRKIEKEAFKQLTKDYPELYDYYIKLREADTETIQNQCFEELSNQMQKLLGASKEIISVFKESNYSISEHMSAREEAKARLRYFKHMIEDCDVYRSFYVNGTQISKENDLQRLFRLVWYGTSYKLDAEANNGRGQVDFIISKGSSNQNIVEFKLASNTSLSHVFTQVRIYETANCTEGSLIAIFCFTEKELNYAKQIVKLEGFENSIDESIFLIDCRIDNKLSASKV